MCRLVSFSKLMEKLADQVHKLIKAITTLLQAMSAKIQAVVGQLPGGELVDSVVDAAGDLVSDGLPLFLFFLGMLNLKQNTKCSHRDVDIRIEEGIKCAGAV